MVKNAEKPSEIALLKNHDSRISDERFYKIMELATDSIMSDPECQEVMKLCPSLSTEIKRVNKCVKAMKLPNF